MEPPAPTPVAPAAQVPAPAPEPETVTVERLAEALQQERRDREAAMVGQEHRLVPAVKTLLEVLFRRKGPDRAALLPSAASAVVWCLVPSAGTAGIGLIALLSLFLTWQQARLLALQNDKIEVQNMLAEAQRRASLVFEISAIFERIDAEKESATKPEKITCVDSAQRGCFRQSKVAGREIFVPSAATLGRTAALTQALRPYRYLTVEGAAASACPQATTSESLSKSYQDLLGTIANRGPRGARTGLSAEQAATLTAAHYSQVPDAAWDVLGTARHTARQIIEAVTDTASATPANALNCAPASPERGQLLVSLHAASIDISAIQAAGGDFTFADFPGAFLDGVELTGVDLSGARLPGASLARSHLVGVTFRGADLSNAKFGNAVVEKSHFEGARIQVYLKDGDAPWFFTPRVSNDNLLSGMQVYQEAQKPNIFERLCLSLTLPSGFMLASARPALAAATDATLVVQPAADFGLLVETRTSAQPGKQRQFGVLVYQLGLPRQVLHQGTPADPTGLATRLEYIPLSDCGKPR